MLKLQGIEGWEIFRDAGTGISLTFSDGKIKTKEESGEEGFGIRVVKQGKIGFAYCENKKDIHQAAKRAAALSRFSPKTKFTFPGKPTSAIPKLDLVDKKLDRIGAKELKGMIEQVKDGLKKYAGKPRISISKGIEHMTLENSSGFSGAYCSSAFSVYAEATSGDGFGFAYEDGIHLPKDFTVIGEKAGRMAKELIGAKKPAKGKYDVIFAQDALDELLDVLMPSFSGEWKRKNSSALADKTGERIADPTLSIYDDGLADASDQRPFDDEGIVSSRIPLIECGVLRNFIYDRETAALEKVDEQGFCNRAHYSAAPGLGESNIVIEGGDFTSLEEELDEYILIHSLHGSHTANTTTGDFGFEVNVAFKKDKNKKDPAPVRGFMLSGNVFKLLEGKLSIEKVVKTQGNLIAPRIAFEGLQVVS